MRDFKNICADGIEKIIEEKKTALIVFWTSWSMPCKMITETMKELLEKIDVVAVDADTCEDAVKTFGIRSVPTTLFLKNGKIADIRVGAYGKQEYEKMIGEV